MSVKADQARCTEGACGAVTLVRATSGRDGCLCPLECLTPISDSWASCSDRIHLSRSFRRIFVV